MVESITAKEAAKAELDTTIVGFAIARSVVFLLNSSVGGVRSGKTYICSRTIHGYRKKSTSVKSCHVVDKADGLHFSAVPLGPAHHMDQRAEQTRD